MINAPLPVNVEIAYEDDSMVGVVKPYGMIVNNADTSRNEFTLEDWARKNIKYQKSSANDDKNSDFYNRAGIVHRLDKETSGILLIAKSEDVFKDLQRQFKERVVEKTYIALCHGKFPEEANISIPVGRLPWNRMRFGILPEGRNSITDFKLVSLYKDPDKKNEILSYIKAFPKTGRTHQIRVHLQYAGYPIYADILYAGRKVARDDRRRLPRHFLHAKEISFDHPVTKKKITIASDLPIDLSQFLNTLEKIS